MKKQTINHWAVLVVVVLGQVIPMIWYGLFSEQWMGYNKLTTEFIDENFSAVPFVASVFASIFFAYVLAYVFMRMKIRTATAGLTAALMMGFAFIFLPTIVQYLFSFRPLSLGFIDGGVQVITWLISGLILGGWVKYGTEMEPAV